MLVKAFRATLEEVLEADLILHIRDISHEDSEAQRDDVEAILRDLGIDAANDRRRMEIWNKSDLLDEPALAAACMRGQQDLQDKPVIVSALTGQGLDEFLSAIETRLANGRMIFDVTLDPANGAGLNWLHENAEIMRKDTEPNGIVHVRVRLPPERSDLLRRKFHAAATRCA